MPVYSFEAMDGAGKVVRQEIEAANRDEAISRIRSMGYFPTKVKEKGAEKEGKSPSHAVAIAPEVAEKKRRFRVFGGVSTRELTNFTVQLSTLQDAGLPIVRSLHILEGQMKPCPFKNTVFEVAEDVEGGSSLSEALAKHPKAFDKLYVNMVKAGEASGALVAILSRLADYKEKSLRLKRRVIGAAIYPAVVLTVAAIIVIGIMVFVIPSFQKMFNELGVELPRMTIILLSIAGLVRSYTFVILIIVIPVGIYVSAILAGRGSSGRRFVDRMKLKLPIAGPVIKKTVIARFSRTLGTLISSGVPILDALGIVKEAIGNKVVEDAIDRVHGSIREGETVAGPLAQSGVFDDVFVNMIDVGEETGALDKVLTKIADNYDEEVDVAVESMTSILEPILIVGLGICVAFVVISLFMPLIAIIEKIGG
jgi:type IV pilus assembly protein PilC